jgi:HD-like signal output (HDOD) protein
MKPRCLLPASDVDALISSLERQLDAIGLPTQPEVAGRVLALVSEPRASLRDFAEVIRADAPLSGRLLRFANSAFFAQRQPVTNLERACVLLGIERLKAVSLGFFLSRAAASDPQQVVARRVWGESVYRACLANALAHELIPAYAPEAFVTGLMLDAGIPIMHTLTGGIYGSLLERCPTPLSLFEAEFQSLPYTHVDVAAALCRRWKLPELLARPIQKHHSTPRAPARENAVQTLQRIAYYVGALQLEHAHTVVPSESLPLVADRVLGLDSERLRQVINTATTEYTAMYDVFREVADSVGGLSDVAIRVHQQLVSITDEVILQQLSRPHTSTGTFTIAGQRIEIEIEPSGLAIAYLSDADGRRLLSYSFRAGEDSAAHLLAGLGLEVPEGSDTEDIETYLRSMAA